MMKAHGIAPNAASIRSSTASRGFKIERQEATTPRVKKRKTLNDFANDTDAAGDDQEYFGNSHIKPDPNLGTEELRVKEEGGQMHLENQHNSMHFLPTLNGGTQN